MSGLFWVVIIFCALLLIRGIILYVERRNARRKYIERMRQKHGPGWMPWDF